MKVIITLDMNKNEISYCGDLVRKYDADKFLLSMFAPAAAREDLWALFAFNHEIAKTREVVSDAMLGHIRLQWWRDGIADIYEGRDVADHEVLKPLALTIERHNLPREHFDKLIYAREFDLEDVALADIEGLVNYADFTTTPLLSLAASIAGDDIEEEHIRGVAVNFALAGILRATNYYERQNRCLIPKGLGASDIIASKLDVMCGKNVMVKGFAALGDIYFKQIRSLDYDVNSPALRREPAFKALRLFWKIKIL